MISKDFGERTRRESASLREVPIFPLKLVDPEKSLNITLS